MNKEEIRMFIEEQKTEQFLTKLSKKNLINFDNYFKYSGQIEESIPIHKFESYNTMRTPFMINKRCSDIHTIYKTKCI